MDLSFLKESSEDKPGRKQLDMELWQKWHEGGRQKEDLSPLFSQFRGTIRSHTNQWVNKVEIPPAAIKAEFNKHFVRAMNTFDPEKSDNLFHWVDRTLDKGNRWAQTFQNLARIPEARSGNKIAQFKTAKAELDTELGREPTHIEIADRLGWPPKTVATLQKELRPTNIASGFDIDPVSLVPSREKEAIHNVYYELAPEEQLVYDHLIGAHGAEELRPMEIAKRLNMNPSKVSNIKKRISEKLRGYL